MAEAILKNKQIDGIEVKSAGIYAASGSEASANAKQVLENNKISHNHRSSPLTRTDVEWADLIVTMTAAHKWAIEQQYPRAIEKMFTLKEFAGEEVDQDIVDPFGGNLAIYEETYQQLEKFIDKLIGKITP